MDLELGELRSFVLLAETLHFGKAAGALHITQPALTKQIQRLEARLAGPLFTRGYGKVALTSAGAILHGTARDLLRQAEEAERLTRLAMQGKAGVLRVGFGIASLAAGLADLLRRYQGRFPNVQISLRDMSTPAQVAALQADAIDVGFVRLPLQDASIDTLAVLKERLVLALPPGFRLPRKAGLRAAASASFVVVSRSVSNSLYDHVMRTCRAAGFAPRVVQEAAELLTVLHLVDAGLGVALVPRSARQMRAPHVRFAETGVDEASWDIGIAWRKQRASDPLVVSFLGLARSAGVTAPPPLSAALPRPPTAPRPSTTPGKSTTRPRRTGG